MFFFKVLIKNINSWSKIVLTVRIEDIAIKTDELPGKVRKISGRKYRINMSKNIQSVLFFILK